LNFEKNAKNTNARNTELKGGQRKKIIQNAEFLKEGMSNRISNKEQGTRNAE
jgi:hypothetical protein